jgi:hypothetical protein
MNFLLEGCFIGSTLEEHSWVAKSWVVVSNMNGLFPIVYGMSSQPH